MQEMPHCHHLLRFEVVMMHVDLLESCFFPLSTSICEWLITMDGTCVSNILTSELYGELMMRILLLIDADELVLLFDKNVELR